MAGAKPRAAYGRSQMGVVVASDVRTEVRRWLNMAEIELNVLTRRCLNRRIPNKQTPNKQTLTAETAAWQDS